MSLDVSTGNHATPVTGEPLFQTDDNLLVFGVNIEDRFEREPCTGFDNLWEAMRHRAVDGKVFVGFYKTIIINGVPYHLNPSLRGTRRYDVVRIWHTETQNGCGLRDCWYGQLLCAFRCPLGDFVFIRYFKKINKNGSHPQIPHRYIKLEVKQKEGKDKGMFVDVILPIERILIATDADALAKPFLVPDWDANLGRSKKNSAYFDYRFY